MKKSSLGGALFLTLLSVTSVFASGTISTKPPVNPTQPIRVDIPKNSIKGLVILNDYFARDEKQVYGINTDKNGWVAINGADRETFKVILGRFAQDNNNIFYQNTILEKVDRGSFVVISGTHGYASDDTTVFGPNGPIEGADPETFKLYTGKYGADSGHVYFEGKKIDADSATFQVLAAGLYAMDAQKVFYNGRLLQGIPVEGFVVKGERAFASDGHVFFEGRVEKGTPLPGDEIIPTTEKPDGIATETPVLMSGETLVHKLFSENGILTPYKTFITLEWPFLIVLGLVIIGIFSAFFVFFAERNDETASWMKTFLKTIIALVVGGAVFWLATYWLSLLVSGIIGGFVGAIAFLSLSDLGGKMKTLFVALLSAIAFSFFASVAIIVLRMTANTPHTVLEFITKDIFQILMILGSIGVFLGSWLLKTQLKMTTAGSVTGAIVATLFSLLILVFVRWLGPLSSVSATALFSLLFGAFVWILSFRLNHTLLLTSIRVLRVMILLGMASFILVWFIV